MSPLLLGSTRWRGYHHHADNCRHDVPWLMLRMLVVVGLVYNVEEVRTVFRSQVVKSTEFTIGTNSLR